ncbi:GDYXXLXY domain-containing protein [Dendrosporobacter sp. 1207_IL3150]|uniref:GDYXXLXY domain-containing protein n=1 Tax=Dendrosporobacter sp. 1207_IL3150 TaxID=3084054 RepID=UPI002FDA5D34
MKNNKILLIFILVVFAQIATPLYMAWHWENILQTGQRFYWETEPIDPFDAFKGRYIDLRFREATAPIDDNSDLKYGQSAYAVISVNTEGKAFISGVRAEKPSDYQYLKVRVNHTEGDTAHVQLPFRRYYLPEEIASEAEAAYLNNAGRTSVAAVRLKDGYGVIEELYLGNKNLREYLRNSNTK